VIEELLKQEEDQQRAKINGEIAKMPWLELQRFFAAGNVMWVGSALDLLNVAYAIHLDNVDQVKTWTDNQQLAAVTNDQAKCWVETDATLWTAVVKPWVLVQELTG
jgi:hypothetical protein